MPPFDSAEGRHLILKTCKVRHFSLHKQVVYAVLAGLVHKSDLPEPAPQQRGATHLTNGAKPNDLTGLNYFLIVVTQPNGKHNTIICSVFLCFIFC